MTRTQIPTKHHWKLFTNKKGRDVLSLLQISSIFFSVWSFFTLIFLYQTINYTFIIGDKIYQIGINITVVRKVVTEQAISWEEYKNAERVLGHTHFWSIFFWDIQSRKVPSIVLLRGDIGGNRLSSNNSN